MAKLAASGTLLVVTSAALRCDLRVLKGTTVLTERKLAGGDGG
jgi:hypothetical protein